MRRGLAWLFLLLLAAPARSEETLLDRLDRECAEAVARVRPGVVQVLAADSQDPSAPPGASASGVVWSAEGVLVTAADVLSGGKRLEVVDAGGRRHPAELLGKDLRSGLAVLRAPGAGLPVPPRGDAQALRPGSIALVIGNAHGMRGSVSLGVVSGLDRTVSTGAGIERGLVQTSAPVNPGDAGGALVNARGEVVGVILSGLCAPSAGEEASPLSRAECVAFAIPLHRLDRRIEQIVKSGFVRRARIGVGVGVPSDAILKHLGLFERGGLLVTEIEPGSPAERAGLRRYDVIVSLAGKDRLAMVDLHECVERVAPGERVRLGILHEGAYKEVEVVLAEEKGGR